MGEGGRKKPKGRGRKEVRGGEVELGGVKVLA